MPSQSVLTIMDSMNDRIKIDIDVELWPERWNKPATPRERALIQLGIALAGVALAAWRVWG